MVVMSELPCSIPSLSTLLLMWLPLFGWLAAVLSVRKLLIHRYMLLCMHAYIVFMKIPCLHTLSGAFPDQQRRQSCIYSFRIHFESSVWIWSVGMKWCSYMWSQPGTVWWCCCVWTFVNHPLYQFSYARCQLYWHVAGWCHFRLFFSSKAISTAVFQSFGCCPVFHVLLMSRNSTVMSLLPICMLISLVTWSQSSLSGALCGLSCISAVFSWVIVSACVKPLWLLGGLQRSLCFRFCFIPASILGLDCSVLVLTKCVLNYAAFFLLSVTSASSVLSGCRLCFGISQCKLCRSLHTLRPSFLKSISLHVISHLSALQCFFNSLTPPSWSLFNIP